MEMQGPLFTKYWDFQDGECRTLNQEQCLSNMECYITAHKAVVHDGTCPWGYIYICSANYGAPMPSMCPWHWAINWTWYQVVASLVPNHFISFPSFSAHSSLSSLLFLSNCTLSLSSREPKQKIWLGYKVSWRYSGLDIRLGYSLILWH